MKSSLILPSYIRWHYTDALLNTWGIITNFIWFFHNFFSVKLLSKNLFTPWHTLEAGHGALGDAISYTFGFMIRVVIIFFAYSIIASILILGIIFFIFWLLLPFTLAFLFLMSVNFLST